MTDPRFCIITHKHVVEHFARNCIDYKLCFHTHDVMLLYISLALRKRLLLKRIAANSFQAQLILEQNFVRNDIVVMVGQNYDD